MIRFLPCQIGANHCRLRHLGWEKCGHGLTSRPRETSDPVFLDSLLEVFGYPVRSGDLLLVPCVSLGGVCLTMVGFRLGCLQRVLVLVLLSSRLLGVGKAPGVVGLKSCRDLEENATYQENDQFVGS